MKFGEQLLSERYEPWSSYYLDYEGLKDDLVSSRFLGLLTNEIQRIVHFFLQQQGILSTKLQSLAEERQQEQEAYTQAAYTLLHLVHYVDLNVTGLRKILKKHDKVTGKRLSRACFAMDSSSSSSSSSQPRSSRDKRIKQCAVLIQSLLQDATLQALYVTISAAFDKLDQSQSAATLPPLEPMVIQDALSNSERATSSSSTRHVLYQIQAARRKLQKSSNFVRMLATTAVFFSDDDTAAQDNRTVDDQDPTKLDQRQRISKHLNLISTFLHMADYYIIAPSVGLYAERLGHSAALAGLIIGLSSVSALASTLLYSWWSTYYSYKSALVFASSCQLIGCLIYAAALPMNSLTMVFMGRLIGGFGSARPINRRYIAETCNVSERTAASAAFVTAGALGTSTGPALAALLFLTVPGPEDDADSQNLFWQVENAPGWIMAVFWAAFVVSLVIYYHDPPRHLNALAKNKSTTQSVAGERQALLGNGGKQDKHYSSPYDGGDDDESSDDTPLWAVVPVVTTFYVYFCLKFIMESVWSSTAILTDYYFDWTGSTSGMYLAMLGLLVLPANWLIAAASQSLDDRDLMIFTQIFILWGCLAIGQSSQTYSLVHFVVGSTFMFVGANCLEGPNLSLLSKAIPSRYRRGFFNVGLLATESGTLGRAMGGVILTLAGSQGMDHILNNAFGIMGALSASMIALCIVLYSHLYPNEDDEQD